MQYFMGQIFLTFFLTVAVSMSMTPFFIYSWYYPVLFSLFTMNIGHLVILVAYRCMRSVEVQPASEGTRFIPQSGSSGIRPGYYVISDE
ncbi:hypothetical protein L596_009939 [Steinernema carpocapsae]|uniref:Uncharacterized protein n=1 Tax=Steinernema carpocapsae TaxID=34508 RepID=A0A4U5PHL6_STECR|nr:hypothetical protein L596_009939 [Steinernema carpocapsae]